MFIEEDYKKIFVSLEFTELEPIKKDIQNGYYISHGIIADKEVVIRVLTRNDKTRVKNYKKEKAVSRILEKGSPKENLSRFAYTSKIGENDKFIWSIREYVSGEAISSYDPQKMLMGYDEIVSKFRKSGDSIISGIKENLNFLWSIDAPSKKNLFQTRFSQEINQKKIIQIESGIDSTLSRQVDFYEKHKDKVFSTANTKASFGDLIPANIIYTHNKNIVFLDFEYFSFDHYLADLSFLWLYLWNYPDWQKKLLNSIIITKTEQISFRINLIRQIIGFYSEYIFNYNESPSKSVRIKRKFFPKHIWTKYLIATGESFEAIMKVRK